MCLFLLLTTAPRRLHHLFDSLGDGLVDLDGAEQPVVAVTAVRGGVPEG